MENTSIFDYFIFLNTSNMGVIKKSTYTVKKQIFFS